MKQTGKEIVTLIDPIMNWNWYTQAEFDHDEHTATIFFHKRWHRSRDEKHPKVERENEQIRFRLVEGDEGRIVHAIRIGDSSTNSVQYVVTNKKNIFEYDDISRLELV